jgi:hypothetical protein
MTEKGTEKEGTKLEEGPHLKDNFEEGHVAVVEVDVDMRVRVSDDGFDLHRKLSSARASDWTQLTSRMMRFIRSSPPIPTEVAAAADLTGAANSGCAARGGNLSTVIRSIGYRDWFWYESSRYGEVTWWTKGSPMRGERSPE